MICKYCRYKNSWDCADGWNRREDCSEFVLDWDALSKSKQELIRGALTLLEINADNGVDW
jgi:hypothetical protein